MGTLLKHEKSFLPFENAIYYVWILYGIFLFFTDKSNRGIIIGISLLIILHGINWIIFKFNYFNNRYLVYGLKIVKLFGYAALYLYNDFIICMLVIVVFIMLYVVINFYMHEEQKIVQYIILAFCFLPAAVASFISMSYLSNQIGALILLFQFINVAMLLYVIIQSYLNDIFEQLYEGKRDVVETLRVNEELKHTQEKYRMTHEQLLKQKMTLEKTNKDLNYLTSEMYIQNELLKYISSTLNINELTDVVTDSIIGAIGVTTCTLIIYDSIDDRYIIKVKTKDFYDYEPEVLKKLEAGLFDPVFEYAKPLIDNHAHKHQYDITLDREVGSVIIMPLIKDHITYGILLAEHEKEGMFVETNHQFFESIATQINIAINNANIYSKIEEMATKDGLTGIYNRKYLTEHLEVLLNEADKKKGTVSLALFDIDKFKRINDTYGHIFGDEAIKAAAHLSEKIALLNGGFAGRYGGEEFVVVLPGKSTQEALVVMNEIHQAIKNHELIYDASTHVNFDVSIGITNFPETTQNPLELLNRADYAMYYSKQNGRGRITIDSDAIYAQSKELH